MSDVLPKARLFIFISMISLLINLSIVGVSALSGSADVNVGTVVFAGGSAFLPFVDLINIATLNLTAIPFVLAFYTIIAIILGALKLFIIAMIILQTVSNIFWSPDV
jgi:hypothetical protein